MQLFRSYLERFSSAGEKITGIPEKNLGYSVVIPCYDEDTIIPTLHSLSDATLPSLAVEIIVVVNSPENSPASVLKKNRNVIEEIKVLKKKTEKPGFRIFEIEFSNMPTKTAGVGLARKTGMDEAVRRYIQCENSDGVIVCFDADSLCTKNYFTEIEKAFIRKKCNTGLLHFEHALEGKEHTNEVYRSIYLYELHLRYYKWALKHTGFPYFHYTIGSSFAVRADIYCKAGGMNKRQAGEDFYFLQKVFPYGKIEEIKSATVIPSPRRSHRVPFGTGAAISEMLDNQTGYNTYNFNTFLTLKQFFEIVPILYNQSPERVNELFNSLHPALTEYLKLENFSEKVQEISSNVTGKESFIKRFFSVFDAFRIIKYLNWAHEGYFEKIAIENEAARFLEETGIKKTERDLLRIYRAMDIA